jgi:hypothetical protein
VPPALEALILRGLRKNKEERYATAFEMKSALLESVGMKRPSSTSQARGPEAISDVGMAATGVSTPVSTPQMGTGSDPTTPSQSAAGSVHGEMAATPPRARRAGTIAVSALLVIGLAAGAYVMIGKKGSEPAVNVVPPPKLELPRAAPPPLPPTPAHASGSTASDDDKADPPPPPPTALTPPSKRVHHERSHVSAAAGAKAAIKSAGMAGASSGGDTAEPPPPPRPPATAAKGPFAEADALFKSGDVEAALAKYQEVARANPSDAKAQRQIGKCYNRLGQGDKAMPYFRRYLELAPDAPDAKFIRADLDAK